MEEKLIEFETAKLAKGKGFPQSKRMIGKYREDGTIQRGGAGGAVCDTNKEWYEAPTQSLLQKLLREVHKIIVEIGFIYTRSKYEFCIEYLNKDYKLWDYVVVEKDEEFSTYEEALEKGLQEALKLIP